MIKILIKFIKPKSNFLYALQRAHEIRKLEESLKQFDWLIPTPNIHSKIIYTDHQRDAKRLGADQLYFIAKRQQEILNRKKS